MHRLLGLQGRLAHIAGHQAGAVHLHQLPLAEHPHRPIDLGQQPGHGGLARARVAQKDQVQGHGWHGQVGLLAQLSHLHQVDQALHVLLHLVQAAQAVQLGEQLVQGGQGLLLGLFLSLRLVLGRFPGLLLGGGLAGGAAGDIVPGVHPGAVGPDAVQAALLQQSIAAGVHIARLLLAHPAVGGGKQQQEQGELVGKAPGQAGGVLSVIGPQVGKEGGGTEVTGPGHAGGHLPIEGGGGGIGPGPDGVINVHLALLHTLPPGLPQAQKALTEIVVHLGAEGQAQAGGWKQRPIGGHRLRILLMKLLRGKRLHGAPLLSCGNIIVPL